MNLYAKAKTLLSQQLIPGYEQEEIHETLHTLENLLEQLQPPETNKVLKRLEDVYFIAETQRLNPEISSRIREGLEYLTIHASDVLERFNTPTKQHKTAKLLVHTNNLTGTHMSFLGANKEFTHIPYIAVTSNKETLEAFKKNKLEGHIDKLYKVRTRTSNEEKQWNLQAVGIPQAWSVNAGEGVRIGVIDTGIDYRHKEIHSCFENNKGYNFVENNNNPLDDNGHGTHVAGTVAGINTGVAPNSTLYALKVLNESGRGYESDILRAAEWAIDHQLHLLNASLGSSKSSPAEAAMIQALTKNNIVLIASAGNSADTGYMYPASYEGVISVAAVDKNNKRANFSQINDRLSVSAPGVNIYSSTPNDGYRSFNGTSMAAPHVTGAAAILYAHNQEADIKETLMKTSKALGEETLYGAGIIQAHKAVQ
ncbi:MAG: S8 family peptidase [Candidatus Woesearchaeota archaeon]